MILTIIIASVFFFQTGYVTCTESIVSITGGVYANLSNAKFMASIYVRSTTLRTSTKFKCVGVIVDKDYILTLEACTINDSSVLKVHVGSDLRGRGYNESVDSIIIRPPSGGIYGNVALLKLSNSLPISNESERYEPLKSIDLPNTEFEARSGMDITVLGYGPPSMGRNYILSNVTIKALTVTNISIYSFCAKNDNTDGSRLVREDRGCPAFYQGRFVGMVVLVSSNTDCPVKLTNIFRVKDFIVGNMTD